MSGQDAAVLLRAAAAGRREYVERLPADDPRVAEIRGVMLVEAATLDAAARVVEGDVGPMYSWLPSWRWTEEMEAGL